MGGQFMGGHHYDENEGVKIWWSWEEPMNFIMENESNEVSELLCLFLSNICSVIRSELRSKRVR